MAAGPVLAAGSVVTKVACLIRVPTEVVKQRTQASPSSTSYQMLVTTLREEGVRGLYRGYASTALREEDVLHAVGQTPTWPGGGAGFSCDSPPTMMDWKSVALSAADHRLELNRLIPTEPLSLHHPSTLEFGTQRSCVIPEGLCGDPEAAGLAAARGWRVPHPQSTAEHS
ncbi:S-adenosylmethionine mitochondrial carrier protein [Takifugu flavidus]|uniref:Mitochondrial S-adenosylmethionine carrier protein n=1 Tax=Takifugu flavidus TaxID=433684 RepID=A0A5C6N4F3_9TELE|nr:S-adenosylmethionine mitochondrial carrier protein [Takifugu flavidus]